MWLNSPTKHNEYLQFILSIMSVVGNDSRYIHWHNPCLLKNYGLLENEQNHTKQVIPMHVQCYNPPKNNNHTGQLA